MTIPVGVLVGLYVAWLLGCLVGMSIDTPNFSPFDVGTGGGPLFWISFLGFIVWAGVGVFMCGGWLL